METLVACLAILLVAASLVDRVLSDESVDKMRRSSRHAADMLSASNWNRKILSSNALFLDVFDAVYGPNFWSWLRLRRSCILSVTFVVFFVWFIGPDNTILGWAGFLASDGESPWMVAVQMAALLTLVNLVADFVSLQETRWVMERTRSQGVQALSAWVIVDVFLTVLIFVSVANLLLVPLSFSGGEGVTLIDVGWFFSASSGGLPFFMSTFGTSILWLGFVASAVAIMVIQQSSDTLARVLNTIGSSSAPARTVAGIIACPTIVILTVYEVIRRWWF